MGTCYEAFDKHRIHFRSCNIYRDGPTGVGYPADARSVGDSHPSCDIQPTLGMLIIIRIVVLSCVWLAGNGWEHRGISPNCLHTNCWTSLPEIWLHIPQTKVCGLYIAICCQPVDVCPPHLLHVDAVVCRQTWSVGNSWSWICNIVKVCLSAL